MQLNLILFLAVIVIDIYDQFAIKLHLIWFENFTGINELNCVHLHNCSPEPDEADPNDGGQHPI